MNIGVGKRPEDYEVIILELLGYVVRAERRRPWEPTSFSSIGRRAYSKGLGLKNIKVKVDNWGRIVTEP